MLGRLTRWLRRKPAADASAPYVLPSDNPETNPIRVSDESAELTAAEIEPLTNASGNSKRLAAIAEMKDGLAELASQVRTLGQRVQAQALGNARLLEALSGLPVALRSALPGGGEVVAVQAVQQALAENTAVNARLCETLAPLQQLAQMPQAAQEQLGALQQVARHQRRQLKQQVVALRAGREALATQRKHYAEMETSNQARLGAIQHENAQNFFKMEQNFRRSARMQLAAACAAIVLTLGALVGAAVVFAGYARGEDPPPAQTVQERNIPKDTVVQK